MSIKVCAVYRIHNMATGKPYIGSSIDVRARWLEHKRILNKGNHHSVLLQRAWDKYGESAFHFEVLEEAVEHELFAQEQIWIDEFAAANKQFGYNMLPNAGTTKGRRASVESRRKMSESRKGRKTKPHSQDARAKMSLAHSGKRLTDEHIEKVRQRNIGKKRSDESRQKISLALKGRKVSEKAREMISERNRKSSSHIRLQQRLKDLGLHSPNQKLTAEIVSRLPILRAQGLSNAQLSAMFNVNRSTISRAISGATHRAK